MSRRLSFPVLFGLLLVLSGTSARAEPAILSVVPLAPADLGRVGSDLEVVAGFVLASDDRRFGGLSGLAVADDGRTLFAVSDRGAAIRLGLEFGGAGGVAPVTLAISPLPGDTGQPLSGRNADAESLRILDGVAHVGFEQDHRILRYPDGPGGFPGGAGVRISLPDAIGDLEANGGLEAFTRLADGRLLLLAEGHNPNGADHRAWLCCGGGAASHEFAISWPGPYVPTDAATLRSGDVLVLLRHFTPIDGVSAKLLKLPARLFAGAPQRIDAGREGIALLNLAPPQAVDNMEGLAILERPNGKTLVFLVSDDNFSALQRTLLLVYRLK